MADDLNPGSVRGERRRTLGRGKLLVGGVVALFGGLFGREEGAEAADGEPLLLGRRNTESTKTELEWEGTESDFALVVSNDHGDGVFAEGNEGASIGILGATPLVSGAITYTAHIRLDAGVVGRSPSIGLLGISLPPGGHTTAGAPLGGVVGVSDAHPGVFGFSLDDAGVLGRSEETMGVGVRAENRAGGIGLDVHGKTRFSTSGTDSIPARVDSHQVDDPAVGPDSLIVVTLNEDPGRSIVLWVERIAGTGFVIHLSRRLQASVSFSYLITEPKGEPR